MKHTFAKMALAIALTGTLLVACGGDGDSDGQSGSGSASTSAGGPPATSATVDIRSFTFMPAEITVAAGATVTWTNFDRFAHTVKAEDTQFRESPDMAENDRFEIKFTRPGTYTYICGLHNSMRGTVTVV